MIGRILQDGKRYIAELKNGETFRVSSQAEAMEILLREYHLEFHEFYGHFNNTPEQYFLFKKEKQAELFQENQNIDSLLLCSNE